MRLRALILALSISVLALNTSEVLGAPSPELKEHVDRKAQEHGVPPALAHGIIKVESGYKCSAKNPHSTATGIMQVVKGTAKGEGHAGPHTDLKRCETGLEIGMRYLRKAWARAKGNICRAATMYNLGIYTNAKCNDYGRRVTKNLES